MSEKNKPNLGFSIVLFVVAGILIAVSYFQEVQKEQINPQIKEEITNELADKVVDKIIIKKPECADSTNAYQKLREQGKVVTLVDDVTSYGANGVFPNIEVVLVNSIRKGSEVACGYLFLKGSTSGSALEDWENFYVKPDQFGGHIETKNPISINDRDGYTEQLFNLNDISYRLKQKDTEIRDADWTALLNVSDRIEFSIALNTLDKSGFIDEVSIVYQCWNPDTGELTDDCELQVK